MKLKKIVLNLILKKNKTSIEVSFSKNQNITQQALFIEDTNIKVWKSLKLINIYNIYTRNFDVKRLIFTNVDSSLIPILIKIKRFDFIKDYKYKKIDVFLTISDNSTKHFYCYFNFSYIILYIITLTALNFDSLKNMKLKNFYSFSIWYGLRYYERLI